MAYLPSVIETIEVSQNKEYVNLFPPIFKKAMIIAVQEI